VSVACSAAQRAKCWFLGKPVPGRAGESTALDHRLPDKVEAAYQRGTMLEKRRALMADCGRSVKEPLPSALFLSCAEFC
jgi:hypothetical protein